MHCVLEVPGDLQPIYFYMITRTHIYSIKEVHRIITISTLFCNIMHILHILHLCFAEPLLSKRTNFLTCMAIKNFAMPWSFVATKIPEKFDLFVTLDRRIRQIFLPSFPSSKTLILDRNFSSSPWIILLTGNAVLSPS